MKPIWTYMANITQSGFCSLLTIPTHPSHPPVIPGEKVFGTPTNLLKRCLGVQIPLKRSWGILDVYLEDHPSLESV